MEANKKKEIRVVKKFRQGRWRASQLTSSLLVGHPEKRHIVGEKKVFIHCRNKHRAGFLAFGEQAAKSMWE
jgi:hypothetical protein